MVYGKLISKSTLERLRAAHWRKRLIVMVVAVLAIEGSVLASIIHQRDVAEI